MYEVSIANLKEKMRSLSDMLIKKPVTWLELTIDDPAILHTRTQ